MKQTCAQRQSSQIVAITSKHAANEARRFAFKICSQWCWELMEKELMENVVIVCLERNAKVRRQTKWRSRNQTCCGEIELVCNTVSMECTCFALAYPLRLAETTPGKSIGSVIVQNNNVYGIYIYIFVNIYLIL